MGFSFESLVIEQPRGFTHVTDNKPSLYSDYVDKNGRLTKKTRETMFLLEKPNLYVETQELENYQHTIDNGGISLFQALSDDDGIGDGAVTNAFCCPICEEMHIYTRRQWYLLAGRHVQRCMCKRQLSSADLTRIQRQKFAKQGMHECTKCKKWMHNVGRHVMVQNLRYSGPPPPLTD